MLSSRPMRERSICFDRDSLPQIRHPALDILDPIEPESEQDYYSKFCRVLKISMPHVGLVFLLAIYTVCGGAIFHLIESSYEEQLRSNGSHMLEKTKHQFLSIMWNMSQIDNVSEKSWLKMGIEQIKPLEVVLYEAFAEHYVTINEVLNKTQRPQWTLPQSIFFATTVITTIGYGHMVPRTLSGQVLCIVFGALGIPLLLITVADIGKFLSDFMAAVYLRFKAAKRKVLKISLPHIGLVALVTIYTVCGGGIFHLIELSHEEQVRHSSLKSISETKARVLAEMWNLSQADGVTEDEWRSLASEEIRAVEIVLYEAYDEQYITINDIMNKSKKTVWTFPQAIFFATTVLTTIGYGNMVPRTVSGRVLCIVFGIFGIPLLMITIADIGKFLSDFITFQYRQYKKLKVKLRKHSRYFILTDKKAKDLEMDAESVSESSSESTEVHLPVVMAMLVLISYTAVGGLLFQTWEGWGYFEAFYFCFITMATIGFGDIVPSEQVYLFFTIIYIVVGLALTTMCIDLAGSEYITKLHYFGQKIETARDVVGGAVVSGLHVGEQIFKHSAFIRTTGGKLIQIGDPEALNKRQASFLRHKFGLPDDYDFTIIGPVGGGDSYTNNMLFAPISPEVLKVVKNHVKLRPDEIQESDAFIMQNRTYNRVTLLSRKHSNKSVRSGYSSRSRSSRKTQLKQDKYKFFLIAPFILKESKV